MSGYPRRQADSERDRDRQRERSPQRQSSRHERRDTPQDPPGDNSAYSERRINREGSGGAAYGGDRERGRSHGAFGYESHRELGNSSVSSEKLPELPESVPIPETGARFDPPERGTRGSIGRPVTLLVNHFVIQSLPIVKIYQYEVQMVVPPSSQRRGSEKVTAMQQAKVVLVAKKLWGENFVFDGNTLGWGTDLLMKIGDSRTALIDLDGHNSEKPNQVEVSIRNSGPLNIRGFVDHLTSSGRSGTSVMDKSIEDVFKALGAIYRQDPASRFITRPKSTAFFVRSPGLTLSLASTGGILEALRGSFQAISFVFGKLCVNVDVVCSAFYTPDLCLVDVAKAFAQLGPRDDVSKAELLPTFQQGCERLIGIYFVVRHLSSVKKGRKMRIQRLTTDGAATSTFELLDPVSGLKIMTSVQDYFLNRYNIKLRYPNIPLVTCRDGMFPLELCYTPFGERYKEALQGQETADFIKWATSPAFVRAKQILENVKRFAWHTLTIPASMGLSVSTSMLSIRGRILPAPIPLYARGTDNRPPETGSWNLRGKKFLIPKSIKSWGLLYFGNGAHDSDLQNLCGQLQSAFQNVGMRAPNKLPAFLRGNPHGDLKEAVAELVAKTGLSFKAKPDILLFLLHKGANPGIYKTIKNICEIDLGVMLVEKAANQRGQQQYCANISLKVNLKTGGINFKVEEPFFKTIRTMILGGDSSHPSPAELRRMPPASTFSALVSSVDSSCVLYTAVATAQPATIENIGSFRPMFKELMRRYRDRNQAFPEAIIYYRDGISDSAVSEFMSTEVEDLKLVLKELDVRAKVTVINCKKRHHTRLFPQSEIGDKLGNVLPGTCAEASPDKNIFLVSQSALQGTVRPTHYTCLLDENDLTNDDFERITHNATFSYGRATRSVSIHPSVYYADQVCERAKMHLQTDRGGTAVLKDVHADLQHTMYWQ